LSPLVSVVLTTHETPPHLLQASIQSVRAQTIGDLELLVVVDGSTDAETRNVLAGADRDDRVRVLEPGRVGRGHALNIGLQAAQSELAAIQDADDESHRERLARQHKLMSADDRYWVLGSQAQFTYDMAAHADWPLTPATGEVQEVNGSLLIRNNIVHTSVLLRRSRIRGIGGYSETRSSQFDLDLFLRVRAAGGRLAKAPEALVLSRVHEGQAFEFGQPARKRIIDNYRLQSSHLINETAPRRIGYRALMLARVPVRLVNLERRRLAAQRAATGTD